MLSTENPSVDLPCSSSSPRTGQICSDEKGPNNHSNQQSRPKLDLFQSSFDETKKQVSNFSLRDYVLSSRDKDLENHWPFSRKNLQLCLKNGVSDVLPPFQTANAVRNPSAVDSSEAVRTIQKSVKRSEAKVISKESTKTMAITDAMASKVCPVCKTFSSSSNTTLNAHIDRCLSEGPSSNSAAKSKATIKHRMKPRKVRLMVDIYGTALPCTLEDLDRRNGTNWASSSSPAKDSTNRDDENMFSPSNAADKGEDGAVYVDSTGTKLRILSKSSDLQSNAISVDDRSPKKKIVQGDKANGFLPSKKKNLLQNRKLLKSSSHAKKVLGLCPKAKNDEQENVSSEVFEKRRMKSADLVIVRKWVGSKRTVFKPNTLKQGRDSLLRATMVSSSETKRPSTHSSNHEFSRKGTNDSKTAKNDYHGKKSHLSLPKRKASSKEFSSETKGFASRKGPSLELKILPHGKNSSPSEKNLQFDTKLASVSRSKRTAVTKHFEQKRRRLRYASESDEEYIAPPSAIRRPPIDRFKDLRGHKNRLVRCVDRSSDSYVRTATETCTLNTEEEVKGFEGPDFTSLDDEYLDSPLPPYDQCAPKHYVEGDNEVITQSGLVLTDELETSPTDNEKNYANDVIMDVDEIEGERNYYTDIEPIAIPGPPGSFLPSPGHMCSDELLQGSSSLTTCKILSEDEEREVVVDVDSSDSPISTTSFVGGSDSVSVIDPSKNQSVVHERIQGDHHLLSPMIHSSAAGSSAQFDQVREEHRESMADGLIKNGQQPCCCSRKGGAFRSNFSGYQEPQHSTPERQIDWNSSDNNSKNFSSPGKVITNISEVPQKFLPSPSTPNNPVLRLMGKNLMVVNNNEENFSPEARPTQSAAKGQLYSRSFSEKGLSAKNTQYRQSSYNMSVQGPDMMFEDGSQNTIRAEPFPQKSFNGGFPYHRGESFRSTPSNNSFYVYAETQHIHHLPRGAACDNNVVQNSYCAQAPYSMGMMMQENVEGWKHTAESSRILLSSQNSFAASSSEMGEWAQKWPNGHR